MVRMWIADNRDHVSLNIGFFEPDYEAKQWGYILADIAKHAARGMQQDDPAIGSVEQLIATIESGYHERMAAELALTGTIGGKHS